MKRILLVLLGVLIFIHGCSTFDDDLAPSNAETTELNLPKASEEYGKAVAKEIRIIVNNLNEKGYDFSSIKNNKKEINNFYSEVYGASSIPKIKSTTINHSPFNDPEVIQSKSELTEVQNEFLNKIAQLVTERLPDEDFKQRLVKINNEVIKDVPKIEQERIFNIVSVLYFSLIEIQNLESKGHIIRQNSNIIPSNYIPRLKSSSEDGGNDEECKEEISYVAVALGAIRTWGTGITEKATQVVKGAGAALGTWIVIWCKIQDESDNIAYCAEIFSRCQSPGNHPSWVNNKPGTSESRCAECMFECTREGTWLCGTNFKQPFTR